MSWNIRDQEIITEIAEKKIAICARYICRKQKKEERNAAV